MRLWVKDNYEKRRKVYRKNRFRVEQVIDWTKDFHTASLYVLARFALCNLILLYRLFLFSLGAFGFFPTGSSFFLNIALICVIILDLHFQGGKNNEWHPGKGSQ